MARQIGFFFFYIGLIITIIAATSFQIDSPAYTTLMIGGLILALGIFLIVRHRPEPPPSERFRTWKKVTTKKK